MDGNESMNRICRPDQTPLAKTWMEVVALVLAFGVAGIYLGQLKQMIAATNAAVDSAKAAKDAAQIASNSLFQSEIAFRTDERAWVEIGTVDKTIFPPDPRFGTTFKFGIYPKNIGKTVAENVRISEQDTGDSGMLMSSARGIKMTQDQLFHEQGTHKRFKVPDRPGPQSLAPGEQSVVPVYASGSEPKHWEGGATWWSYVIGRIDYDDAFGAHHWTHFCFIVTNAKGDLAHCQYGNDKDKNPEPLPPKPN